MTHFYSTFSQIVSTHDNVDNVKLLLDDKTAHFEKMQIIQQTFGFALDKVITFFHCIYIFSN